jgi:hypothetical protein
MVNKRINRYDFNNYMDFLLIIEGYLEKQIKPILVIRFEIDLSFNPSFKRFQLIYMFRWIYAALTLLASNYER